MMKISNQTMPLQIIKADISNPAPELVDLAVKVLRDGGLVVAPTETRYGLLCRADDTGALMRLFEAKRRPLDMPTSVFVASPEDIGAVASMNGLARSLADSFLPGPLTMILKAGSPENPPVVVDGRIGVRVSSAPLISQIVRNLKVPISATSANISGRGDPASVSEIAESLGDYVSLYLDGGDLTGAVSTVVDVSSGTVQILREGAVANEAILDVLEGKRNGR